MGVVQARPVRALARRGGVQLPGEDGRADGDGGRDRDGGARARRVRLQQQRVRRRARPHPARRRQPQPPPVLQPAAVGRQARPAGRAATVVDCRR